MNAAIGSAGNILLAAFATGLSCRAFSILIASCPWLLHTVEGDTIDVKPVDGDPVRIRLAEIDALQKRQSYGQKSKQALAVLIGGDDVTLVSNEKRNGEPKFDRYRQLFALIQLADGRFVQKAMVQNGHA